MTTQFRFEMKGMAAYLEDIQKAGLDIDAAAQRALMKGALILQNEMRARVPIGSAARGDKHPGNLLAHIKIKGPMQNGNYSWVEVGVIHDIAFTDANTAIYGNVIEYGSPSRKIPAHSYIRAAIDRKRVAAMRAIRESLQAEGLVE